MAADGATALDKVLGRLASKQFVFVGGKGGVGKTTASSSLAVAFARRAGKRVLLVSTDPAHNVSDSLEQPLSGTAQEVTEVDNLWALEIDPAASVNKLFGEAEAIAEAAQGDLMQRMKEMLFEMRDWISHLPGIDEAIALVHILENESLDKYDHVVLDTAPTGHTLKLLQLPGVLELGIKRLEGWRVKLSQYINMAAMFFRNPTAEPEAPVTEQLAAKLRGLKASVEKLRSLITDEQRTSFVCVGIAEALSVHETKRLTSALKVAHVGSSVMLVNKLFTKSFLDESQDSEPSRGDNEAPASKAQKRTADETPGSAVASVSADADLKTKALALCRSRAKIQHRYLSQLMQEHGSTHLIVMAEELMYEPKGTARLQEFASSWYTDDDT